MRPSLSSLPPELLCRVFESAEDFSAVAALGQTARIFYNTWRENPTPICEAVAPRVFSNFNDAQRLVAIQEEADADPSSQPNPSQLRQNGGNNSAISRAKRLLFNARCASAACESWVIVCNIRHSTDRGEHLGEDPYMTPSERARFEHAFYCLWTVGVMARATHLQEQMSTFLDRCSPRELFRLDEMGDWVRNYSENNFRSRGLDLDLHDETWTAGCDVVSKRWIASPKDRDWGYPYPYRSLISFFAFFDHTQIYLDRIPDHW